MTDPRPNPPRQPWWQHPLVHCAVVVGLLGIWLIWGSRNATKSAAPSPQPGFAVGEDTLAEINSIHARLPLVALETDRIMALAETKAKAGEAGQGQPAIVAATQDRAKALSLPLADFKLKLGTEAAAAADLVKELDALIPRLPSMYQEWNRLQRQSLRKQGDAEHAAGRYREAISLYRQAIALEDRAREEEEDEKHVRYLVAQYTTRGSADASSINSLAYLICNEGDLDRAEPLYRRALEARERKLGSDHPETLSSLKSLATLLHDQGDWEGAEPLLRRVLELEERTPGQGPRDARLAYFNLLALLKARKKWPEAHAVAERAVAGWTAALGAQHWITLEAVREVESIKRTMEAQERMPGPEHPDTLDPLDDQANLLRARGDLAGAERLYRQALAVQRRTLGVEHPDTLHTCCKLANLLFSRDDLAGAQQLYIDLLRAQERVLGVEHPDTVSSLNNMASIYRTRRNWAMAELHYRRALVAQQRTLGPDHPDTQKTLKNLASLLHVRLYTNEAEKFWRRALDAQERTLGKDHPDTLRLCYNFAVLLDVKKEWPEALALMERVAAGLTVKLGEQHPDTIQAVKQMERIEDNIAAQN